MDWGIRTAYMGPSEIKYSYSEVKHKLFITVASLWPLPTEVYSHTPSSGWCLENPKVLPGVLGESLNLPWT